MIFSGEVKAEDGSGIAQALRTKINPLGQVGRPSEFRVPSAALMKGGALDLALVTLPGLGVCMSSSFLQQQGPLEQEPKGSQPDHMDPESMCFEAQ